MIQALALVANVEETAAIEGVYNDAGGSIVLRERENFWRHSRPSFFRYYPVLSIGPVRTDKCILRRIFRESVNCIQSSIGLNRHMTIAVVVLLLVGGDER